MILITGCTACGKGTLAFELARRSGGQILSIDSMKVYRCMDIGTAKPSLTIRQTIKHHLIDVVEPHEQFSFGRYIELADQAIADIQTDGHPIIAVGGTAMFIRGLLEGIFDGPPADPQLRATLNRQADDDGGSQELHQRLTHVDPAAAQRIHPNDLRRIVRALEVYELTGRPISSFQSQFRSGHYRYPWRLIGLSRSKENNSSRINRRVKLMVEQGLVAEVQSLLNATPPLAAQAAQAVGYAEIIAHLTGKLTLGQAIEQIKINTRRLAKSQRTWFRSFTNMHSLDVEPDETTDSLADRVEQLINTQ